MGRKSVNLNMRLDLDLWDSPMSGPNVKGQKLWEVSCLG